MTFAQNDLDCRSEHKNLTPMVLFECFEFVNFVKTHKAREYIRCLRLLHVVVSNMIPHPVVVGK